MKRLPNAWGLRNYREKPIRGNGRVAGRKNECLGDGKQKIRSRRFPGRVEPEWRCITQLFGTLSPWCLQTRIRPSWCCRQMGVSSVKTTSFHSAAHILLSSHHWWRRRLWFCVKGRPSNGRLADRQLCCERRRMVRADIE
ncbi:hypothetical protein TNCV_212701 [Trichonephila clavipes]|nr:hypothetical protein TNCV_212701 [Trichonephila clavipes]